MLLRLVDADRCWVKLSAAYGSDLDGAPVKHAPERMVWGSNWPHPDVAVVPEDQALLDALGEWIPDEAARHRVLVENPARLYRF